MPIARTRLRLLMIAGAPFVLAPFCLIYAFRSPDASKSTQELLTAAFFALSAPCCGAMMDLSVNRFERLGRPILPFRRTMIAMRWFFWSIAIGLLAQGLAHLQTLPDLPTLVASCIAFASFVVALVAGAVRAYLWVVTARVDIAWRRQQRVG
jgi:hypothetical protein